MRKIIFLIHMSLDGKVADPNGGLAWAGYNSEIEADSHSLHAATDTAIYGRLTFDMMDSYWPGVLNDSNATESEKSHARWYRDATKIVISRTMSQGPGPNNTLVIGSNIAEQINAYKQQPGKDIWLLGSPTAAQEFMRLGLIDEYRINLNPIILGDGQALFEGLHDQIKLRLVETKQFPDGIRGLRYVPEGK